MKFFSSSSESNFLFSVMDSSVQTKVVNFEVVEKLSSPFEVTTFLASEDLITFDDVVGKEAVLTISGHEIDRYFHGMIRKFNQAGKSGRFNLYNATIVPSLWLLSLESDCRIFQNQKLTDIISTILTDSDITADRFEFRLKNKNIEKKYCVQYRETDLEFISRIIAEEGIYYFFEHNKNQHLLVFADDPVAHKSIPGESVVMFNPTENMVSEKECIYSMDFSQRLRTDTFSHTNFNFKQPSVDLKNKDKSKSPEKHEVYDYPGNFGSPERGRALAKIRQQEMGALKDKAEGSSYCSRFIPGFTFILAGHDMDKSNTEFLLIEVRHFGQQPQSLEETASAGGSSYSNSFASIPFSITYRPVRIQKPSVNGLQSAFIVGPKGEEIHTDEYGRVKVQFHWDREGQKNEKSSCWLRISQPWSGQTWGMISIPRVGDEVLVDFINGDLDWPIVVGSVNNAASPALYDLPANKSQSGIRTRSTPGGGRDNFNELRFEDKKGAEEIYLQSEKDWNILVKNDKGQNVGRDEILAVGNNRTKTVGVNQMVQVGANHTESIGSNKTISVGSNKTETVAINSAETIGLAKELSVGGLYQVTVGGVMNETVVGAKTEEVGLTKAVLVTNNMTEKVIGNRSINVGQNYATTVSQNTTLKAKSIVFEADDEIVFKTGKATISLKSSGDIVITGASITEKATGEIVIKGAKTAVN